MESVNGCYKVVTRNLNWTDTARECRSLHDDAHALVINDAEEQAAVAGMLDSVQGECPSHARTVVRECCKGDDESRWERGKFDPRHPKTP